MAFKGLSTALTIVVAAIILLIIAVLLVTLFGHAISPFGGLVDPEENCKILARNSCQASNRLPETWYTPTQKGPDNRLQSCYTLLNCNDCNCPGLV